MSKTLNQKRRLRLGTGSQVATVSQILAQDTLTILPPRSGLADRLYVLSGFMALCDLHNKNIRIYWPINDECNGKLSDIFDLDFECIEFDEISENEIKSIQDKHNFVFTFGGGIRPDTMYDLFHGIIIPKGVSKKCFIAMARDRILALSLREVLRKRIEEFTQTKFGSAPVGIHLRRTDMVQQKSIHGSFQIKKKSLETIDRKSFALISEHAHLGTHFFLACDNKEYQKKIRAFLENYGCTLSILVKDFDVKNLRQTSLEDAACDLFLLSQCQKIISCGPSGFSCLAAKIGNISVFSVKMTSDWYACCKHLYGWCKRYYLYRQLFFTSRKKIYQRKVQG